MIPSISRHEIPDSAFSDAIRAASQLRPHSEIRQERATDHKKNSQPSHEHQKQSDKPRFGRVETMRLSINAVANRPQHKRNHDEPPHVRHGVTDIVDYAI